MRGPGQVYFGSHQVGNGLSPVLSMLFFKYSLFLRLDFPDIAKNFPVKFCRELFQNWPNLRGDLSLLQAQIRSNAENSLLFP
jgi:hypothetical protein